MKHLAFWRAARAPVVWAAALILLLFAARGAAGPVYAAPGAPISCQFGAISVTAGGLAAQPGLWDAAPSGAVGRAVYFAPPAIGGGQITVAVSLTAFPANQTCYLYHSAAFGVPAQTAAVTETQTAVLAFPAAAGAAGQTLDLIAADTPGGTVQLGPQQLDFIPDRAAPTLSGASLDTQGNPRLYATGARLFYGVLSAAAPFTISGRAVDGAAADAAGLALVRYSAAFGDTPPAAANLAPYQPLDWTAVYTLPVGLTAAGHITATAADRMGHLAHQPFTYEPDLSAPTSQVTATVSATTGAQPIILRFGAADAGAGVRETTLYYTNAPSGAPMRFTAALTATGGSGVFTFTPPTLPITAPLTYAFTSRSVDRVDNHEALRVTADATVVVQPQRLFLPSLNRGFRPFANGSFEQGQAPWEFTTGSFAAARVGGQTHGAGGWSARLGNPAFAGQGDVPVGHSSVWQAFSVPNMPAPRLTLWYHLQTYDMVYGYATPRYYDAFEIYINQSPADGDTPDPADPTRQRLCRDRIGQADTRAAGLVFCDGGGTRPGNALVDLGWRSVTLDLSAFRGQNMTLYLANFNRVDGYYNTWTYVDDMSTNW